MSDLNIIDKRHLLKVHSSKKYAKRSLPAIDTISVHHSLTKTGSAEAFARYHVNHNKWPGIGYHFVIEIDGSVVWCNDITNKTYHVGNSNKRSIGICLVGDFRNSEPTDEQVKSLFELIVKLQEDYNVKNERVLGHFEHPGYDWKLCPCINMVSLRLGLKSKIYTLSELYVESNEFYTVKRGDTIWKIATDVTNLSTKELLLLNPEVNPKNLKIGQKIKLK